MLTGGVVVQEAFLLSTALSIRRLTRETEVPKTVGFEQVVCCTSCKVRFPVMVRVAARLQEACGSARPS